MGLYYVDDSFMTGMADAIRKGTGSTEKIYAADMPEKITSMSGGLSEIQNGTLGSYVSYDEDIPAGTFVELRNKLDDNSSFEFIYNQLTLTPVFTPSAYQLYTSIIVQDICRLDDNNYMLVIQEAAYTGSYTSYIYLAKVTVSNGIITNTVRSSTCVTLSGSAWGSFELLLHNGYCYLFWKATATETGDNASRTVAINCTKVSWTSSSVSIVSTTKHTVGTYTGTYFYIGNIVITEQNHAIIPIRLENVTYTAYKYWLLAFDVTSTSTSNYFLTSHTESDCPIVTNIIGGNKVIATGQYSTSTFSRGVYTYSSNGLTFSNSIDATISNYFQSNLLTEYTSDNHLRFYNTDCTTIQHDFIIPLVNQQQINIYSSNLLPNNTLVSSVVDYDSATQSLNYQIHYFVLNFNTDTCYYVDTFLYTRSSSKQLVLKEGTLLGAAYEDTTSLSKTYLVDWYIPSYSDTLSVVKCVQGVKNDIHGITQTSCKPSASGDVWIASIIKD